MLYKSNYQDKSDSLNKWDKYKSILALMRQEKKGLVKFRVVSPLQEGLSFYDFRVSCFFSPDLHNWIFPLGNSLVHIG